VPRKERKKSSTLCDAVVTRGAALEQENDHPHKSDLSMQYPTQNKIIFLPKASQQNNESGER
jgi:hypothetical protein